MLSKAAAYVLFTSEKTSERHHRDNTETEVKTIWKAIPGQFSLGNLDFNAPSVSYL